MASNDINARINALVKYVLDIKPYHTKLLGFTSELSFNETLDLTLIDSLPQHTIYHQNVWGSADIPSLASVSDGTAESKIFILPPTVMPRFSVTDSINYGQSPIGDDQALADLEDADDDGIPDTSYPWPHTDTFSHQLGDEFIPVRLRITELTVDVTAATTTTYTANVTVELYTEYADACGIPLTALELRCNGITTIVNGTSGSFTTTISGSYDHSFMEPELTLPGASNELMATAYLYRTGFELWAVNDTGRYYVPFHNAARVRVNNVVQTFGAADDWIVDSSRSFIQFMAGKHPALTDNIDINLMNSDRLFISVCSPFITGSHGYDTFPYDELPYDIGGMADGFVINVDTSAPNNHVLTIINLEPGVSKAEMKDVLIYPSQTNGCIWQMVADGLYSVTVQQIAPIVGPIEHAIINEPFDNGKIAFTLRAPWHEYYLTNGVNGYVAYDMLPFDDEHYEGPPDEADFWPGVDIKTQHGVVSDPLPPMHAPVQFNPLGELKHRDVDGKPQYIFEFTEVPAAGSFIEFRVEQAKQLNPRLQMTMHEHLRIVQFVDTTDGGPEELTIFSTDIYSTHQVDAGSATDIGVLNLRLVENGADERHTENDDQRILESE